VNVKNPIFLAFARGEARAEGSALGRGATGYAGTNRVVSGDAENSLTGHPAITCTTPAEIRSHPQYEQFERAVPLVPALPGSALTCFRGVTHVTLGRPPCAEDFCPLPTTSEGRFNRAGEPVLYLSNCEEGVRREVRTRGPVWVQQFILPLGDRLRIADFADLPERHPVNQAMWFAELAGHEHGPKSFLFGQLVADHAARFFDGMFVRGVHGPDPHYRNVVVFRPLTSPWRSWLHGDPWLLAT